MIHAQNNKVVSLLKPQSVATNGTATGTVNCAGYDYAEVIVHLDTAAASSTDATLQLSEGDGTTFTTATDLSMTTVAPNTSNPDVFRWFLDLRKRKKNLKITYTPSGAARLASAIAVLSRPEQAPTTLAQQGGTGRVIS